MSRNITKFAVVKQLYDAALGGGADSRLVYSNNELTMGCPADTPWRKLYGEAISVPLNFSFGTVEAKYLAKALWRKPLPRSKGRMGLYVSYVLRVIDVLSPVSAERVKRQMATRVFASENDAISFCLYLLVVIAHETVKAGSALAATIVLYPVISDVRVYGEDRDCAVKINH